MRRAARETLAELAKHLSIFARLVRMNIMSQLEYRVNFVTGVGMEMGYLAVKILYVVVAYRSGRSIGGYSADQILVFVGTFVFVTGFYAGLFMMNLFQLSGLIRDGSFDMLLIKPVSTQFLATFRRSDFGIFLLDTAAGITLVAIGLSRSGIDVGVWRLVGYGFFVASGAAVGYAIYLIPMTFVFRIINANSVAWLADSFWDFNNVPMVAYRKVGRAIGVFLIPIFVVTNFPTLFVLGKLTPVYFVWAFIAPPLFLMLAGMLWRYGIRNYVSANG